MSGSRNMRVSVSSGDICVDIQVPGSYNTDALDDMAARAIKVYKETQGSNLESGVYGPVGEDAEAEEAEVTEE